jgi:hypothetical protein
MEKETIEEFALRNSKYTNHSNINTQKQEAIILGAKWQAERMYSEEEVKELCKKSRDEGYDENTLERIGANEKIVPFGDWFEQFKKK